MLLRTATTCGSFFSSLPRTIPSVLLSAGSGTSAQPASKDNDDSDTHTSNPKRMVFIGTSSTSVDLRDRRCADSCACGSVLASDKSRAGQSRAEKQEERRNGGTEGSG